jgi:2-iminobutanoate/2-iminopropanoate deaminase
MAPALPFTPAVRAGEWLIVSGQVGIADGALVEGGTRAQARQAIRNLAALLHANGVSLARVVKTTVFLTSMDDYAVMNEVYAELFGEHRPARSAVAVAALPIGATFEIEAWVHMR